jgi:hypothetical protein
MGVPISDVGYTSAKTGRGDHEVHKGHVALEKNYHTATFHRNVNREVENVFCLCRTELATTPSGDIHRPTSPTLPDSKDFLPTGLKQKN